MNDLIEIYEMFEGNLSLGQREIFMKKPTEEERVLEQIITKILQRAALITKAIAYQPEETTLKHWLSFLE